MIQKNGKENDSIMRQEPALNYVACRIVYKTAFTVCEDSMKSNNESVEMISYTVKIF